MIIFYAITFATLDSISCYVLIDWPTLFTDSDIQDNLR